MLAHNQLLQSMRGLAALMVLLGHSMYLLQHRPVPALTYMLLQPSSAVCFFYVLSGYVLGESLRRARGTSLRIFAGFSLKRLTRLLPVYWLAVLVGIVAYKLLEHSPIDGVNPWLGGTFGAWPTVSLTEIERNILGLTVSANGALWSVQVELFIIPVLPALVFLSCRVPLRIDLVLLAMFCGLAAALLEGTTKGTPWGFLAYLNCFYLGIILPKLLEASPAIFSSARLCGVSFGCFLFLGVAQGGLHIPWSIKLIFDSIVSAQLIAIVLLGGAPSLGRILAARPLIWLGDISYSFYAYSTCILMVCGLQVIERTPQAALTSSFWVPCIVVASVVLTLLIALPLAWASYRFVERPLTSIGRRTAEHIVQSREIDDGKAELGVVVR
jgi:peptidoglycan/LPS O-acetylase OafA/YrhL